MERSHVAVSLHRKNTSIGMTEPKRQGRGVDIGFQDLRRKIVSKVVVGQFVHLYRLTRLRE